MYLAWTARIEYTPDYTRHEADVESLNRGVTEAWERVRRGDVVRPCPDPDPAEHRNDLRRSALGRSVIAFRPRGGELRKPRQPIANRQGGSMKARSFRSRVLALTTSHIGASGAVDPPTDFRSQRLPSLSTAVSAVRNARATPQPSSSPQLVSPRNAT